MTWCVPPYDRAVAELVAYVRETWRPLGILLSGSIVRGEAGPLSDLDVNVVHAEPWRQRVQRRFAGVPAELFVNPPAQLRRYFASEHAAGRPTMAHMFSTGEVLAPHAELDALVAEARDWLARPLAWAPVQLAGQRYMAIDWLDDARDVIDADPISAQLLMAQAVEQIIACACFARGRPRPHRKRALAALAAIDPVAADLVRAWAARSGRAALEAALALARHVLGVDTFFEWSSDREAAAVT